MFFTINLREPTPIELAESPSGLDVTSSFHHLRSLREFVNTLRPSNSIRILIAMQKQRMNEFLERLLRKASVIVITIAGPETISCENALIAEIIKREPTILITDLAYESELKKAAEDSLVRGVILINGKQSIQAYDDGKIFKSLRKPVKPALLVKTLHEILLSALSHFESSEKNVMAEISIPAPKSKWLGEYLPSNMNISVSPGVTSSEAAKPEIRSTREDSLIRPTDLSTSSFARVYPLRLMLAEDNLLNQQLMTRILAKYGYTNLYVVDNGRQAFEVFRRLSQQEAPIEAIFMDMQMPEVEGPEATHLIRTFCRQTGCPQPHIMALTAKAFSEDRAECMRAGMCSYLSKPVRWTTLEEELIKANGTVNNRINCDCNEERIVARSLTEDEDYEKKEGFEKSMDPDEEKIAKLPVAQSTGLDV